VTKEKLNCFSQR